MLNSKVIKIGSIWLKEKLRVEVREIKPFGGEVTIVYGKPGKDASTETSMSVFTETFTKEPDPEPQLQS
jgi:hypothetical protein